MHSDTVPRPNGQLSIIKHPAGGDGRPQKILQIGPYEIASLIPPEEEGAMTAYRVTIEPHQTTPVSYHKAAEEIYFVVEGSGTAVLDGKPVDLRCGDFLRLPPGTTHGFVTGKDPLVMLDVHSPGSRPGHDVFFVGTPPNEVAARLAAPNHGLPA